MAELVVMGKKLAKSLNRRRRIAVELPEFAVRAIQWRVEEANARDDDEEQVTFNDVIEWLIVTEVTFKKIAFLESNIPGFTAAMFVWLMDATYQPEGD